MHGFLRFLLCEDTDNTPISLHTDKGCCESVTQSCHKARDDKDGLG